MTRKDYVLIAEVIKDWQKFATSNNERVDKGHAANLADMLAEALKRDNSRFDAEQFIKACAIPA